MYVPIWDLHLESISMKIAIIGTVHQKLSGTKFRSMIESILLECAEHTVCIESRFYALLLREDINLAGVRSITMNSESDLDLIISIGGDGTFLRAIRQNIGTKAPFIGINAGRLGFLASVQSEDAAAVIHDFLRGEYESEERTMLEVMVEDEKGTKHTYGPVLNEVAIVRRDNASTISVTAYVDGEFVVTYQGDGILVSTPTGSTAYALSVGGPITHPQSPTICICPIASHSLSIRPLVIGDHSKISLCIESRSGSFLLACDGKSTPITSNTAITIRKSDVSVKIAHPKSYSYFATLQQKLMWGQDARSGIALNDDGSQE